MSQDKEKLQSTHRSYAPCADCLSASGLLLYDGHSATGRTQTEEMRHISSPAPVEPLGAAPAAAVALHTEYQEEGSLKRVRADDAPRLMQTA